MWIFGCPNINIYCFMFLNSFMRHYLFYTNFLCFFYSNFFFKIWCKKQYVSCKNQQFWCNKHYFWTLGISVGVIRIMLGRWQNIRNLRTAGHAHLLSTRHAPQNISKNLNGQTEPNVDFHVKVPVFDSHQYR